ncbi:MAG: hypothetical protein K1X75_11365 [Leptospirales bacterium]|nr:hypothetical protein [Leptospirales bacterium]
MLIGWRQNLARGGMPAAVVHLIMLYSRFFWIAGKGPACASEGCPDLLLPDLPLSLVYFFLPDLGILIFSLVFGTFYWCVAGAGILTLIQRALGTSAVRRV